MHSSLILIIVFMEAFPAHLVLIHAHFSCLKSAMLRVAMFKDVPRQFYVLGESKALYQKLASFV